MMLNPVQVKEKFGPLFSRRFLTMVDRKNNVAGVELIDVFGDVEGRIGAVAAIALSEEKTAAAAMFNDKALDLIK